MLGALHSWHWPIVLYVVPVHTAQPVRSLFGPVPAPQAEQIVLSAFTTLGWSQLMHSAPNAEYVVPLHAMQAVRLELGSSPGAQLVHDWWLASTTLGALHS